MPKATCHPDREIFYKSKKSTLCASCYRKADYEKHKNKQIENNKEYLKRAKKRKAHYDKNYSLKKRYNITFEDYQRIYLKQNGCCCICGILKSLNVDHDHKTGKVRGLLCQHCNIALGLLQDDIILFEHAIKYLTGANEKLDK